MCFLIGRSTRVSNEDPVITCVGDRTHHLIENLDPSTVSIHYTELVNITDFCYLIIKP